MKKIIIILALFIITVINAEIVLVPDDFDSIQDAIDYLSNNEGGTVAVKPGTYTGSENKNLTWYPWSIQDGLHIAIKGLPDLQGEVIIDCEGSGIAFIFDDGVGGQLDHTYNDNDRIENLVIRNGYQGIVIKNGSPVIKNNIIEDCVMPYDYSETNGAGISCISSAIIDGNQISDCIGNWVDQPGYHTYGGGIYVENNTNNSAIIKNNIIDGCSAKDGGGIYCTGSGEIILDGNMLTGCTLVSASSGYFYYPDDGLVLACFFADNLQITNNIFYDNLQYGSNIKNVVQFGNCGEVLFQNNTIINNEESRGVVLFTSAGNPPIVIQNNILADNYVGILRISGTVQPSIEFTLMYNNAAGNYINCTPGTGCLSADPQLSATTYQPIWTSSIKSPCIDTGNPSLLDPDDTPSDIGAVRAIEHRFDEVLLPSPAVNNGIKWLSFPALDVVLADADLAENVLAGILDPTILNQVLAQTYSIFYNVEWQNIDRQFLRSDGFKFHMNAAATLEVSGFKLADNATVFLAGNGAENWLGYWLDETQHVSDAFSDYWSSGNIYFIQHQFWTAAYRNGEWYYQMDGERQPTISYGEMVIVKCQNEISNFRWDNGTPEEERTLFPEPQYYSYQEQASYLALFVELDESDLPLEIGVFVDDICIGASVVTGDLCQINAYTASAPAGDLELELYYGSRSEQPQQRFASYKCSSLHSQQVEQQITTSFPTDAWFVSLRKGSSDLLPLVNELSLSNYPNPFNPSTTISYSLPYDSRVSVCIYNIKGQLVNQLVDGSQPEGSYEVNWDGRDASGKAVSSGIYYSRVQACGRTLNRKMLLLK